MLLGHHSHENDFCDDLIKQHAPELRNDLEAAHEVADATIARLHAAASQLLGVVPQDRWGHLRSFYLDLADFTGAYIEHLRFEEDRIMPALNVALTNEQVETITNNIRGSVPPPDMCIFIRYMVPSMNFSERLDMLGGMHAGAPPEIFEMFRAAAEDSLDPADYRAVAAAGGFA